MLQRMEAHMHTFLTLALGGCDGQCAPATLPP